MTPAPARRRPHCAPGICSSRARLFFRRISGDTRPRTVSSILSCWRVIGAYGWRMMINAVRRIWTWCPRAPSRQLRGIGAPRNSGVLVGWLKHMEHIDGSRRLPLPSLCLRGCVLSRAIGEDPQHWARLQPRVIHTLAAETERSGNPARAPRRAPDALLPPLAPKPGRENRNRGNCCGLTQGSPPAMACHLGRRQAAR
jgi:hypothetical protein